METLVSQEKNQKVVKLLSWGLIAISAFLLLRYFVFPHSISSMVSLQKITRNFNPPIEINFTLYFIQTSLELLLYILVFVIATFLLKYQNKWRKALIDILIVAIIYFILSPIITYYNIDKVLYGDYANTKLLWSYLWSIILSSIIIVAIKKLMKEEVRMLFK
jgi:hypothetical protein